MKELQVGAIKTEQPRDKARPVCFPTGLGIFYWHGCQFYQSLCSLWSKRAAQVDIILSALQSSFLVFWRVGELTGRLVPWLVKHRVKPLAYVTALCHHHCICSVPSSEVGRSSFLYNGPRWGEYYWLTQWLAVTSLQCTLHIKCECIRSHLDSYRCDDHVHVGSYGYQLMCEDMD